MNTRMPFYSLPVPPPPPPPPTGNFHPGPFPPPFHPATTPPPPGSPNWDRNNARNGWKRRNWNHQFNNVIPYVIPKKPFGNRFQQARQNVNGAPFFENNANGTKWNNKKAHNRTTNETETQDSIEQAIPGIVATKKKRKPMSKSYPSAKWDEKDAEKALMAEKEFAKTLTNQSLLIKFPDPDLGKEIVKQFHPAIENVHFPQPSTPRFCFAHLKEDADIDTVVSTLEKIPFGQGFLQVELKRARVDTAEVSARDIDPYTLYVGNLPLNVTKSGVIQHFKGCTRIDIGHPQQMKNTRYAFVRFAKVEDAIAAYKNTFNTLYDSRSLIVRFRRINGNVGIPGESKAPGQNKHVKDTETQKNPNTLQPTSPQNNNSIPEISSPSTKPPPDLSLVKEEPNSDHEDEMYDVKPPIPGVPLDTNLIHSSPYTDPIKSEYVKKEMPVAHKNEDEIEDEEEDDEFDARNDNFKYNHEGGLEDECDDFEDDDDYDVDDEDLGLQMNGADNYLPGDDDEDIFNEK